ncbi:MULTISPECIES: hypothetical protein [unclassified Clostridium]|uniref:hypothetical protein n=1 Tax=unclassified Clostridium TaxID=2614128 RepID=UPI0025BE1E87|nr:MULTISPECIES: hypothetical protein [unclassified Clostridium]
MKYFEFNTKVFDYYALIGAENELDARQFYISNVGDIDESQENKDPKEITKEIAVETSITCLKGEVDTEQIEKEFEEMSTSKEPYLILIDTDLL